MKDNMGIKYNLEAHHLVDYELLTRAIYIMCVCITKLLQNLFVFVHGYHFDSNPVINL